MNRPQIQEIRKPDGLVDLGKFSAPKDVRLERVKVLVVDMSFIAAMLQADGSMAVRMEGWPKGAEVLNASTRLVQMPDGQTIGQLCLLMYHQSFPRLTPGEAPETFALMAFPRPVPPEEPAEGVEETVDD